MGNSAIQVAKACNYYGAGTVEFILDEKQNFYFLEMNTRLQVEHPVTEQITGVDLVKQMIRIAAGEHLELQQEDLSIRGHAVEVRVYAEDPENNFLPDVGNLKTYVLPQGNGVRVDDGFEEGMDIPIFYDPMLSKLITFGANRQEALDKMVRAIDEYTISGVKTTLSFCRFVMQHETFKDGSFDTNFVANYYKPEYIVNSERHDQNVLAALFAAIKHESAFQPEQHKVADEIQIRHSWKNRR
jgi:propionyl-CoA carboxylase alpha chain